MVSRPPALGLYTIRTALTQPPRKPRRPRTFEGMLHIARVAGWHSTTLKPVICVNVVGRYIDCGSMPIASTLLGGTFWRAICSKGLAIDIPAFTWRNTPPKPGHIPRSEMITDVHVGQTFLVHSGKDYKRVKVTPQMVLHKFGEFVLTRRQKKAPLAKGMQGKKKR